MSTSSASAAARSARAEVASATTVERSQRRSSQGKRPHRALRAVLATPPGQRFTPPDPTHTSTEWPLGHIESGQQGTVAACYCIHRRASKETRKDRIRSAGTARSSSSAGTCWETSRNINHNNKRNQPRFTTPHETLSASFGSLFAIAFVVRSRPVPSRPVTAHARRRSEKRDRNS